MEERLKYVLQLAEVAEVGQEVVIEEVVVDMVEEVGEEEEEAMGPIAMVEEVAAMEAMATEEDTGVVMGHTAVQKDTVEVDTVAAGVGTVEVGTAAGVDTAAAGVGTVEVDTRTDIDKMTVEGTKLVYSVALLEDCAKKI